MKLKWSSFRAAFAGVSFLLRTQIHARWHLLATVLVVASGAGFRVTKVEWLALILALALVWVTEAVNTAVEQACDAITMEKHPHIAHAKNVAAGAVLLAAVSAALVGAVIFVPEILHLLRTA